MNVYVNIRYIRVLDLMKAQRSDLNRLTDIANIFSDDNNNKIIKILIEF